MNSNIVKQTRDLGLCLSCEICAAICPHQAVSMQFTAGQFLPRILTDRCSECGLCLKLCPGIDFSQGSLPATHSPDGPCRQAYSAYCKNQDIRTHATSGGIITGLIVALLDSAEYDAAFVLNATPFSEKPPRLNKTESIDTVIQSAKSKYIPASVYEVIKSLQKMEDKRYIIVGTPCQFLGIKKHIAHSGMSEQNLLFLGLFCDKTLNQNIITYFADKYRRPGETLSHLVFRSKENSGWPGHTRLVFSSGREAFVDRKIRMQLKPFFQLKRCLFCCDKLNSRADIACGDCYVTAKGSRQGTSSIIVRTDKGATVLEKHLEQFEVAQESIETIRQSQNLHAKRKNELFTSIFKTRHNLNIDSAPSSASTQATDELKRRERHIRWGQEYRIHRIHLALLLTKVRAKALQLVRRGVLFSRVAAAFGSDLTFRPSKPKQGGDVVLIFGGELFNKGAQAMTFTAINSLKNRFPGKKMYLCSTPDYKRSASEKERFSFGILPADMNTKSRLIRSIQRRGIAHAEGECINIVKQAAFCIDISGYQLSSAWGFQISLSYILNILLAKSIGIPYYILPQSIGPFQYPLIHKLILFPLFKKYLTYPAKIFARESESLRLIKQFTKQNAEKSCDIVLTGRDYTLTNLFTRDPVLHKIRIAPQSIGIIPNEKVLQRTESDAMYAMYRTLIEKLLSTDKTVYILGHSSKDAPLCEGIKTFFPDNEQVRLVSSDLNAIELEHAIRQFDFIIASRYHSIVHAYKNGIPALVIGWADKYHELLKLCGQLDCYFDIQKPLETEKLLSALDMLLTQNTKAGHTISERLKNIPTSDVFQQLG